MALICCSCHRWKTAKEASGVPRAVELPLDPGDTNVYIFTDGVLAYPVDRRTPREAIKNGCALSLLTYKRVSRTFVDPVDEVVDYEKMLQKFVYAPRIVC